MNRFEPQSLSALGAIYHMNDAARALYYVLHSLQHRGQDAAGMACTDGERVVCEKNNGMLSEIFQEGVLAELNGCSALGHVRLASAQDRDLENVQPIVVRAHQGHFAIAATGTIQNAAALRDAMEADGLIFQGVSDAELIAHLIQFYPGHLFEKIMQACSKLEGSYTFVVMTKNTMYAMRSPDGIHPLWIAQSGASTVVASESAAFTMLDIDSMREVRPGELIRLGLEGAQSFETGDGEPARPCAMEYVYYARPDSMLENRNVHAVREDCGILLAEEETVDADIVVGVPDTAMSAAAAFARALNKPYEIGLIKNRYIGSTYIRPSAQQREQGIRTRLNAISSIVRGKRVYLVDDSLVKGFTAKRLCQLMKEAGASEVHLRIASPRIAHPCVYGYEEARAGQLAAARYTDEEMCQLFGADSIRFLDEDAFRLCVGPASCMACMNGRYVDVDPKNGRK